MALIVTYDELGSPQKVLQVLRRADPAPFRGTTGWVLNPDLSLLDGLVPQKYWKHDSGSIVEFAQGEKDAQDVADAAALDANVRGGARDLFDGFDGLPLALRAFADIVKDEINILRSQHGLGDRTLAQLKTAIKNRIDSGSVDS
jgi:hypothetical protein